MKIAIYQSQATRLLSQHLSVSMISASEAFNSIVKWLIKPKKAVSDCFSFQIVHTPSNCRGTCQSVFRLPTSHRRWGVDLKLVPLAIWKWPVSLFFSDCCFGQFLPATKHSWPLNITFIWLKVGIKAGHDTANRHNFICFPISECQIICPSCRQ